MRAADEAMDLTTKDDVELLTDDFPAPGAVREVAPGLLWARLPLPMRLNHVNLWFMREYDGWLVIDAGLDARMCRDAWEAMLAGPLGGQPIRHIVLTHGHPDHVGLSGWLVDRFGCPFSATRTEWLFASWRREQHGRAFGPQMRRFLMSHGCDEETVAAFARQEALIERGLHPVPEQLTRLRNGDRPVFGGWQHRVIVASGHADEHASFYREDGHVLIAGDQILQRITPVIGVFGNEPAADPLSDYLASLKRFEDLPADTLVLPSHGLPFFGLQARLDQLREHHRKRLADILAQMGRPHTAFELATFIFARAMQEGQGRFALAETLAHLHHGETIGVARRSVDAAGTTTFARV